MSKTCPKCHNPFVDGDKLKFVGISTWHEYNKPPNNPLYAIGRPETITRLEHMWCPLTDGQEDVGC